MVNFKLKRVLDKLCHVFYRPFRKHLILKDVYVNDSECILEYNYVCPYCGYEFITSNLQQGFNCFSCGKVSEEATMRNLFEVL